MWSQQGGWSGNGWSRAVAASGGGSPLSFSTQFIGDTTTMVQSGGKVTGWASLDGGGQSFSQATGANQPAYSSGMVFDGTTQLFLDSASFVTGGLSTLSIFVLVDEDATVTNDAGIFAICDGSNPDYNIANGIMSSAGAGAGFRFYRGSNITEKSGTSGLNRWGVIFDGANGTGYLNNSSSGLTTVSAASTAVFPSPARCAIGCRLLPGTSANYFKGTIKKLVVSSVALNSTQRAELDTWLQS